jgi:hypothetical protein
MTNPVCCRRKRDIQLELFSGCTLVKSETRGASMLLSLSTAQCMEALTTQKWRLRTLAIRCHPLNLLFKHFMPAGSHSNSLQPHLGLHSSLICTLASHIWLSVLVKAFIGHGKGTFHGPLDDPVDASLALPAFLLRSVHQWVTPSPSSYKINRSAFVPFFAFCQPFSPRHRW